MDLVQTITVQRPPRYSQKMQGAEATLGPRKTKTKLLSTILDTPVRARNKTEKKTLFVTIALTIDARARRLGWQACVALRCAGAVDCARLSGKNYLRLGHEIRVDRHAKSGTRGRTHLSTDGS